MIELKNISKKYSDITVYDSFEIAFKEGLITAILGKSGCGKTTLLNIISGLTDYTGEIINKPNKVSYVFQEDRLIPSLTVKQNLQLIVKGKDIEGALKKAGLYNISDKYPKELSGGMARRVSILRAFLYEGELILLDEPFKDLDIGLKYKLMDYFKELRKNFKSTVIFVTHDIDEAVYLAERAVILDKNKIIADLSTEAAGVKEILTETMKMI